MENNLPVPGTPEYDEMMKQHYGENYEYGYRVGFGRRLGAYLLDFLFVSILMAVIASFLVDFSDFPDSFGELMTMMQNRTSEFERLVARVAVSIVPISLATSFFYYSTEVFFAASPGKMLLGILIGRENRTSASFGALASRFLLKEGGNVITLVSMMTGLAVLEHVTSIYSFAFFIGCFFVLGMKRQAFHDMISKTAVYHRETLKEHNN